MPKDQLKKLLTIRLGLIWQTGRFCRTPQHDPQINPFSQLLLSLKPARFAKLPTRHAY